MNAETKQWVTALFLSSGREMSAAKVQSYIGVRCFLWATVGDRFAIPGLKECPPFMIGRYPRGFSLESVRRCAPTPEQIRPVRAGVRASS